jgi:hypothetical protein
MKNCFSLLRFALVFLLFFFSCKKKKSDPAIEPTPMVYQGVFTSQIYVVGNGTLVTNYGAPLNDGFICSHTLEHNMWDPTSLVDAGNVSLNGVSFGKHLSVPYYYRDTTATITFNPPHVWSITGTGRIPAFTFINTNTYPVFNGYNSLPDSFQISLGATIPVNNYSNVDEIEVAFQTQGGNSIANKYFLGNVSTIQFSASELNAIGVSKNNTLIITFYKNNNHVINGNNYVFRTGYLLRKQGIKFQ